MANVLKVIDVVSIGIEKEKARRDFYSRVAEHFNDADMKDLFGKLRDWEDGHVKKFEAIRNGIDETQTVESYPGEMSAYMDALVDDRLYREVSADSFGKIVKDPVTAIQYGIGFEKDAILLFMELIGVVQTGNTEAIQELITEERHHIVQLIRLRKKYS